MKNSNPTPWGWLIAVLDEAKHAHSYNAELDGTSTPYKALQARTAEVYVYNARYTNGSPCLCCVGTLAQQLECSQMLSR